MLIPDLLVASATGAAGWRLGGGAFTTLTGISYGTQFARLIRAVSVTLPAAVFAHNPLILALILAVFLGVCMGGWGPFQGLGLPSPYAPEKSWLRWLPERLGLKPGTVFHDAVGLIESGLLCLTPSAVAVFAIARSLPHALLVAGAALTFPIAYAVPRLIRLPSIPKFASGQAWGEVFVGAFIAAALTLAVSHA